MIVHQSAIWFYLVCLLTSGLAFADEETSATIAAANDGPVSAAAVCNLAIRLSESFAADGENARDVLAIAAAPTELSTHADSLEPEESTTAVIPEERSGT